MKTTAMAMVMALAMASAGLMVNFFLFRLVSIVDPQWHCGSTLANRLDCSTLLFFFSLSVLICILTHWDIHSVLENTHFGMIYTVMNT